MNRTKQTSAPKGMLYVKKPYAKTIFCSVKPTIISFMLFNAGKAVGGHKGLDLHQNGPTFCCATKDPETG